MKIIDADEFFEITWRAGWAPKPHLKLLQGRDFDCVCGNTHTVSFEMIAREMPKSHFVLECPNGNGVVCVKIKGLFSPQLITQYAARHEA